MKLTLEMMFDFVLRQLRSGYFRRPMVSGIAGVDGCAARDYKVASGGRSPWQPQPFNIATRSIVLRISLKRKWQVCSDSTLQKVDSPFQRNSRRFRVDTRSAPLVNALAKVAVEDGKDRTNHPLTRH